MNQQDPRTRKGGNAAKRLRTVLVTLAAYLGITSLLIGVATYFFFGTPQPLSSGFLAGFVVAVWTLPVVVFVSYFATAPFAREAVVPVKASVRR